MKRIILSVFAALMTAALLLVHTVPVFADVIGEPYQGPGWDRDDETEEPQTEAPETAQTSEVRPDDEQKKPGGSVSSEARNLSAPIIAVSASVLVIAAALLVRTIVRAKKKGDPS